MRRFSWERGGDPSPRAPLSRVPGLRLESLTNARSKKKSERCLTFFSVMTVRIKADAAKSFGIPTAVTIRAYLRTRTTGNRGSAVFHTARRTYLQPPISVEYILICKSMKISTKIGASRQCTLEA